MSLQKKHRSLRRYQALLALSTLLIVVAYGVGIAWFLQHEVSASPDVLAALGLWTLALFIQVYVLQSLSRMVDFLFDLARQGEEHKAKVNEIIDLLNSPDPEPS
ncbi:MAG: hypothetical protein VX498_14780 [Myxococcota bacterium]|nr:hypothetical protein [Myxococcota bacterium]